MPVWTIGSRQPSRSRTLVDNASVMAAQGKPRAQARNRNPGHLRRRPPARPDFPGDRPPPPRRPSSSSAASSRSSPSPPGWPWPTVRTSRRWMPSTGLPTASGCAPGEPAAGGADPGRPPAPPRTGCCTARSAPRSSRWPPASSWPGRRATPEGGFPIVASRRATVGLADGAHRHAAASAPSTGPRSTPSSTPGSRSPGPTTPGSAPQGDHPASGETTGHRRDRRGAGRSAGAE